MKLFWFLIQTLSITVLAKDEIPQICQNDKVVPTRNFKIPGGKFPEYFFKVSPNGLLLGYITYTGNNLLNLNTGQRINFPGEYDPVFSPDGELITHPSSFEFYSTTELDQSLSVLHGKNSFAEFNFTQRLKYVGKTIQGVYQSIGQENLSRPNYRIITDNSGITVYNVERGNNQVNLIDSYSPCSEGYFQNGAQRSNFSIYQASLPMISKDGHYISFLDDATQTTKIVRLDEKKCTEVLDIGYPTGKVDFSFDGNLLAFHVGVYNPIQRGYFSGVNSGSGTKDVLVLKVEKKNEGTPEEV